MTVLLSELAVLTSLCLSVRRLDYMWLCVMVLTLDGLPFCVVLIPATNLLQTRPTIRRTMWLVCLLKGCAGLKVLTTYEAVVLLASTLSPDKFLGKPSYSLNMLTELATADGLVMTPLVPTET